MTSTATAEQTAAHLQYVIDSWPQLIELLDTRHGAPWPPAARMSTHIANLERADATADELAEAAAHFRAGRRAQERADSRFTLGESPAPIRLQIVDVMRTVETDLVYLADVLAQEIQRPPMAKAPAFWLPADQDRRNALAAQDAADPRRWRYRQTRTAVYAAAWLRNRVQGDPGPFLPLGQARLQRIAATARTAQTQVLQALSGVRRAQVVDRPCPLCGGILGMSSGDGEEPVVACFQCRQEWRPPVAA